MVSCGVAHSCYLGISMLLARFLNFLLCYLLTLLLSGGSLWCCGSESSGQLGDNGGVAPSSATPTVPSWPTDIISPVLASLVSVGTDFTLALVRDQVPDIGPSCPVFSNSLATIAAGVVGVAGGTIGSQCAYGENAIVFSTDAANLTILSSFNLQFGGIVELEYFSCSLSGQGVVLQGCVADCSESGSWQDLRWLQRRSEGPREFVSVLLASPGMLTTAVQIRIMSDTLGHHTGSEWAVRNMAVQRIVPHQVLSLYPATGIPGKAYTVVITGTGFASTSDLACWFGSQQGVVSFLSETQVGCVIPPVPSPQEASVEISTLNAGKSCSGVLFYHLGALFTFFSLLALGC